MRRLTKTLLGASVALPLALAAATQAARAACGPCGAKIQNPCGAAKKAACNPCAAKKPDGACHPCAAKKASSPCNPCAARK